MPEETVAGTPADPTLDFTELKLGKKTYKLIYDFDAIARAEELTGLGLLAGIDWRNIGVRKVRGMLYASMLFAHPEIALDDQTVKATLKELTKQITPWTIGRIENALHETWISSTAPKKENDEDAENPPTPAAAN